MASDQRRDGRHGRSAARYDLICAIVLLLVWIGVWIPRLKGPIDLRWDASTYYVLGTALAEGKGYRLLNEPGEIEAVQYPPLLPLIVAAHQRVLDTSDYVKVGTALRLFYFVLSGFYLLTIYALARSLLAPLPAFFVGTSTALSFYSFMHISDTLYAELPFAFVTTLFLLFHQRESKLSATVLEGLLGTAAYLLRTAGLALLAAWIVESLLRRRFRDAALRAVIAAIPFLLWQTYTWRVTHSDKYRHPVYSYQRAPYYYTNVTYGQNSSLRSPFRPELGTVNVRQIPARVVRNMAAIPLSLGESSLIDSRFGLPGRHWHKTSRILTCWLIAIGVAAIVGAVLVARSPHWFLSLYFTLMLSLIVLTPWPEQFWRYLAPLTPLTLSFALLSVAASLQFFKKHTEQWVQAAGQLLVVLMVAGMLLIQIAAAVYFLRTLLPVSYYDASSREKTMLLLTYDKPWHSVDSAFEWVRVHAPRDAVIATAIPQLAYLRSEHKAVLPPFELDRLKSSRLLDEIPVRYLVIDELGGPHITERYSAALPGSEPEKWNLVFTAPDARSRIYERTR
jgi:hypothetical protein